MPHYCKSHVTAQLYFLSYGEQEYLYDICSLMPLFDITMAFHVSNGLLVINIFNVYHCWSDSDQTLKSTRGEGSIDIIQ